VIQPSLVKGQIEGWAMLTMYNCNGVFIALEEAGYLLMSLALACLIPVYSGEGRVRRAVRWLFGASFVAVVLALIAVSVVRGTDRGDSFEIAVFSIIWLTLIAAGPLLAVAFRRPASPQLQPEESAGLDGTSAFVYGRTRSSEEVVMRRTFVGLALVAILTLALVGCGGSDGGAAEESPAATTPAAESPAAESPDAEWTTVATLSSTDPTNDMDLHVSEEFAVSGDAQLVLDMPDGGDTDGVIAAFLVAGEPITVEAGTNAESVALAGALPTQVVSGLDGSYVLLVTPASTKAWSVEVQTQQ